MIIAIMFLDNIIASLTWLLLMAKQQSPKAYDIRDKNIVGPFMSSDFAKAGKCLSGDRLSQSFSSDVMHFCRFSANAKHLLTRKSWSMTSPASS